MDEQGSAATSSNTAKTVMSERVMVQPSLRITQQPREYVRLVEPCQLDQLAAMSGDNTDQQQQQQQASGSRQFTEIECECELENMTLNATDLANLDMYVVCSIEYDNGDSQSSSLLSLKCLDSRTRLKSSLVLKSVASRHSLADSYVFEIDRESMKSRIRRLCVLKRTDFEVNEMSESAVMRDPSLLTHFDSKSDNDKANLDYIEDRVRTLKESQSLLVGDGFRLKLQVIIHDKLKNKSDTFLTEPVFTVPISIRLLGMKREQDSGNEQHVVAAAVAAANSTSSILDRSNLRIFRSSRIYGSVNGGDEIILLTSLVDPNDIQVEFFQFKNDTEITWRSFATLNKTDVHGNCSLVFRTPAYKSLNLTDTSKTTTTAKTTTTSSTQTNKPAPKSSSRIKVYYRLYRPSTGEHSDKWVYFYCENSMYDEFRLLFGDRVVNESRLITKMFAQSRISPLPPATQSSSSSPFGGGANTNKRKMDVDETTVTGSSSPNTEMMVQEGATTGSETNASKKLLKKWYKKEIVDRSNKDAVVATSKTTTTPQKSNHMGNESDTSNGVADDEMADEQQARLIECAVNTPTSSVNTNDDDEVASTSSSGLGVAASPPPSNMQNNKRRVETRDGQTQTNSEDSEELKADKFRRDYTISEYVQLKSSYESCLNKMNALADRTSKALLKFARTRSLRDFFKTQRFLLSTQDEDGNTPIHLSVLYGNLDMLAIFTDVAATISFQNIINIKNNNQLTALMIAAYLGEVEVCEFLLEANADLTVTDLYGCNVVHIACKNKNLELLKVIIKYVNKNNCYSVLNAINHDGCAPIHLAVLSESNEILSELLYNGRHLKINIPDKKSGYTALHYASIRAKLTPLVNLLVKNEDIDVNAKSYIGCTPLHIAVANKNYMSTICLLRHGADLNIQSDVPVHSDWELFQHTQRKSTLLRRCVETVLSEKKSIADSSSELKKSNELSSSSTLDERVHNLMAVDESNESKSSSSATLTSSQTSQPVLPSLGGAPADFIKTSQEVRRRFDAEMETWCDDETNVTGTGVSQESSFPKAKIAFNQHNYDAFYYAQNDPWMLEIFKAKKTLPRSLLEKTLCFERAKEFCLENRSLSSLSNSNIKSWVKITKEALDQVEKKPSAQIKISQQATEPNDDAPLISDLSSSVFHNADTFLLDADRKHLLSLLKGSSSPTNDIVKP